MIYKTIVLNNISKVKKMASAIEKTANETEQQGWEFMDFSLSGSSKAILVFRAEETVLANKSEPDNTSEKCSSEAAGDSK